MTRKWSEFDAAVRQSIAFLRRARRTRDGIVATRRAFEALRRRCAPFRLELVVDSPPGTTVVDYDVLLTHGRETTMLGWHRDEGRPWSVDYAEHWAADYVVTVDGRHVSIRDALVFLGEARGRDPGLARELIDQAILANEVERNPPNVTAKELAHSVEVFLIARGLGSHGALEQWLAEEGTNPVAWREWLAGGIRISKVKDRICRGRIVPYFRKHRAGLATVLVHRASAGDAELARELFQVARKTNLAEAIGEACWRGADVVGGLEVVRLDEVVGRSRPANATPGSLLGPMARDGRHLVVQVLKHRAAKLDADTRHVIRNRLVAEWVAEQRARASIEWHR